MINVSTWINSFLSNAFRTIGLCNELYFDRSFIRRSGWKEIKRRSVSNSFARHSDVGTAVRPETDAADAKLIEGTIILESWESDVVVRSLKAMENVWCLWGGGRVGREARGASEIASKVKSGRTPCHFQTQPAKITRSNLGFVIFFPSPLLCARPIKNIARNRSKTFKNWAEQTAALSTPFFSSPFRIFCTKRTSTMSDGLLEIYIYIK